MRGTVTWHAPEDRALFEANGLSRYEDFITPRPESLVWRRKTTQTYRLEVRDPAEDEARVYFLKHYRYGPRGWRFLLRRDKPSTEARNYAAVRRSVGDVVPHVVATGRRRRFGLLRDAFILTRGIPRAVQLDEVARQRWSGRRLEPEEAVRQRALLTATADLVRRLHAASIFHIDLQWRNILARLGERPEDVAVFLIDLPRGGRAWSPPRRRHGRFRDLSSLDKLGRVYLSRSQRLRWFLAYTGRRRLNTPDRRLIRDVQADRLRYERGKAAEREDDG